MRGEEEEEKKFKFKFYPIKKPPLKFTLDFYWFKIMEFLFLFLWGCLIVRNIDKIKKISKR